MTPSVSSAPPTPASSTTTQPGVTPDATGTKTGTGGGSDSFDQAFEFVSKLFKLVQSLGLGSGGGSSDTSSDRDTSPVASSPPPQQIADPPVAAAPTTPTITPTAPTTGVVDPSRPSQPPVGGGPATTPPPPSTGTITNGTAPRPTIGAPPKVVSPPWWTVTTPKPVTPAPRDDGKTPSVPPNPLQGIGARPGPTVPGGLRPVGPIAAARPGVIHGRVQGDVDGRPGLDPVRGASVSISDGPGGAPDRRATTNDQGSFTFAGLAAGRYSLVVSAAGFRSATVSVSVTPGEDVPVNLTLQRQARPTPVPPSRVPHRSARRTREFSRHSCRLRIHRRAHAASKVTSKNTCVADVSFGVGVCRC